MLYKRRKIEAESTVKEEVQKHHRISTNKGLAISHQHYLFDKA